MQIVYFTLTAIVLYLLSDHALDWLERRRGARFEHRTLIFFVILLILALVTFQLIGRLTGP